MQWGTYEVSNIGTQTKTITLPIAFNNATYTVLLGHNGNAYWTNGANVNYTTKTTTTITVYWCDGRGFGWAAIGI